MSLRRTRRANPAAIDMTPLSDIIFSLLLFFILTQSFLATVTLDLPRVRSGEAAIDEKSGSVEITASGSILVKGRAVSGPRWADTLAAALAGSSATETFLVKAHKDSHSGTAVEVLDCLRGMGIRRVAFLATGFASDAREE